MSEPVLRGSPVVRVDFTKATAWNEIRRIIESPSEPDGFGANVSFVDNPAFEGVSGEKLAEQFDGDAAAENDAMCLFIVDAKTIVDPLYPVLVVKLGSRGSGASFRVVAKSVHVIENNLAVGNRDFDEYRASALLKPQQVYGV